MKASYGFCLLALALPLFVVGCGGATTTGKSTAEGPVAKEYDFKGRVADVAADKQSVTLDHEAIPALDMMAMKMKYRVESPKVLEGVKPGDRVGGRLKKTPDGYVVTSLQKQ